jgi:hypothetical protein
LNGVSGDWKKKDLKTEEIETTRCITTLLSSLFLNGNKFQVPLPLIYKRLTKR